MEFSLPEFPAQPAAQAAFIAAALSVLIGLVLVVVPATLGRVLGLQDRPTRPGAIGELRAAGGFLLGLALATLMFDQPVLYVGLGSAFAVAAFARLVSLMSDHAASFVNILLLLIQVALAGALLYAYLGDVFSPESMFSYPEEFNARLVFYTYAFVALVGAAAMFAPRLSAAVTGLQGITDNGYSAMRSAGGFSIGTALTGMAFMNPMMDLGFAAALAVAVACRILSLLLNRGNYIYAAAAILVEGTAAALVLSYVIGMM